MSFPDSGVSVEDISNILRKRYAIFTGAHDKEFRSLIVFPDVHSEPLPDESYSLLLEYFSSLPSTNAHVRDFAVLIDRRTSDWSSVKLVVSKLNQFPTSELKHIYVLKPQGLLQRFFVERTMASIRDYSKFPVNFVDKTTELLPFIDPAHLPTDIGGELSFNVDDWIRDRLSIESFRKKAHYLCTHEGFLVSTSHRSASSASLNEMDFGSGSAYIRNPCYAPITFCKLRRKRRQWLDRVISLEIEGLQLCQALRNNTEPIDLGAKSNFTPPEKDGDSDISVGAHKDVAFDLPVDRVFHLVSMEHILVRLTEARAKYSSQWGQYVKLFQTVKLMASVEKRFLELQSLAGIWENLLESAQDYRPDQLPAIYQESKLINPAGFVMHPASDEPFSLERDSFGVEGLESVLNRLREADEFGSHLVSDLSALSQTSKWLVSCVLERNPRSPPPSAPLGAVSLSRFHLGSDNDTDSESLSNVLEISEAQDFTMPPLVLPENIEQWPLLFDRLLHLAKTGLPQSVDQLSRLYELHCEITHARLWLRRGHAFVESTSPVEKFCTWDLPECHKQLSDLVSFLTTREQNVRLLTDPRRFRSHFGSLLNPKMHAFLRELLKEVEDVDSSLQATTAALRQHISRVSFPRHQPTSHSILVADQKRAEISEIPPLVDPLTGSSESEFITPLEELYTPKSDPEENLPDSVRRFNLAWEELLETERAYVTFLNHVYDVVWVGNLPPSVNRDSDTETILTPPFMSGNQSWLLANWPDLLYFHRDHLLPGLEDCHCSSTRLKFWSIQMVPRLTDLYSAYCSLYPNTVHAAVQLERDRSYASWLTACSEEVHRRETAPSSNSFSHVSDPSFQPALQLSARLVTPVQRFQRYHLLINQLLRLAPTETDRAELSAAHKSMVEMCKTANLAVRFRGLSMRPSEMGWLLLRADFTISRDDSRTSQQRHAFLFTNAILLAKLRNHQTSYFPIRVGSVNPPPPCTESSEGRERSGSSYHLSSIPLVPSLAALVKAYGSSGSGHLPHNSGPVYEVREELPLAQIGLTPNVRADRRRFAVWTANRAQTYVFYTSDTTCRDLWVRSINDLLMEQLRRLRDEALKRHLPQRDPPTKSNESESTSRMQYNRSNSLPVPGEADIHRTNKIKNSYLSLPSTTREK